MIAFADEEGARFNTPTFGSRALSGGSTSPTCSRARDDDGVALADAMRAAGADPERLGRARRRGSARLRGFLELHIDQTRDLERLGAPAGAVRALASRMRLALDLRRAAPTTRARPAATSAATRSPPPRG